MAITSVTETTTATGAATRAAVADTANEAAKSKISADFDTYLTMLTTQLKYQDPTSPTDSAEFAVQLATFSGVEQQTKTNDLLTNLTTRLTASGLTDLAGWVGMEAKAKAPAYFHGDPVALWPAPDANADRAEVVVTNGFGHVVGRYDIDVSSKPVSWAGNGSDGNTLPDGLYSFEVLSYKNGVQTGTSKAEVYSLITEVRLEDGETVVVLLGDTKLKASDVTSLRNQS